MRKFFREYLKRVWSRELLMFITLHMLTTTTVYFFYKDYFTEEQYMNIILLVSLH